MAVAHHPSETNPPDLTVRLQEALAHFQRQESAQAAAICTNILAQDPRHFGATHLLGVIQAQSGDLQAALESLKRALTLNPRSSATHFHLGLTHWKQARPEAALKHFQFSLTFQRDNREALFHCAIALQVLLRHEASLIQWDRLLALEPKIPIAHLNRGLVLQELGQGDAAGASFSQALYLDPTLAETLLGRARELGRSQRHAEALSTLQQILSILPEDREALSAQAQILESLEIDTSAERFLSEWAGDGESTLAQEQPLSVHTTTILAHLPEVEFAFGRNAHFAKACLDSIPRLHREGRFNDASRLATQCAAAIRAGKLPPGLSFRFLQTVSDNVCELAMGIEAYRCQAEAGGFDPLKTEVYFHDFSKTPTFANTQLNRMWERTLPFLPLNPEMVDEAVRSSGASHEKVRLGLSRDKWGSASFGDAHISFTLEEIAEGDALLVKLGIPEGKPFVCFHARDQGYDKALGRYQKTFTRYRDSNIEHMLPAAAAMTELGYAAVRMGSSVECRLKESPPGVIDYASSEFRSDFLDVYLMSRCKFYIGGDAGLFALAEMFRRPVVFVNFSVWPEVHTWFTQPFIAKKYWSTRMGRLLTFREIFETGASTLYTLGDQAFQNAGIELIENSPEEIRDLALEVEARMSGTWKVLEADVQLQRDFWNQFKQSVLPCLHGHYRTRLGAAFLRENQTWLLG